MSLNQMPGLGDDTARTESSGGEKVHGAAGPSRAGNSSSSASLIESVIDSNPSAIVPQGRLGRASGLPRRRGITNLRDLLSAGDDKDVESTVAEMTAVFRSVSEDSRIGSPRRRVGEFRANGPQAADSIVSDSRASSSHAGVPCTGESHLGDSCVGKRTGMTDSVFFADIAVLEETETVAGNESALDISTFNRPHQNLPQHLQELWPRPLKLSRPARSYGTTPFPPPARALPKLPTVSTLRPNQAAAAQDAYLPQSVSQPVLASFSKVPKHSSANTAEVFTELDEKAEPSCASELPRQFSKDPSQTNDELFDYLFMKVSGAESNKSMLSLHSEPRQLDRPLQSLPFSHEFPNLVHPEILATSEQAIIAESFQQASDSSWESIYETTPDVRSEHPSEELKDKSNMADSRGSPVGFDRGAAARINFEQTLHSRLQSLADEESNDEGQIESSLEAPLDFSNPNAYPGVPRDVIEATAALDQLANRGKRQPRGHPSLMGPPPVMVLPPRVGTPAGMVEQHQESANESATRPSQIQSTHQGTVSIRPESVIAASTPTRPVSYQTIREMIRREMAEFQAMEQSTVLMRSTAVVDAARNTFGRSIRDDAGLAAHIQYQVALYTPAISAF
ncbi:uncharacterized protein F4822DRAFT_349421 [Hypoxylon trugodes]|uniref:uncharacterized protein n=1 Tax=Hypoxylon trugodes TaxID=326681 RepID=UPI0021A1653E|nr:uncharacterized protein F4822DRAFT_349421 [Hypoxylon trugodes]KAI1385619.1 hypothetical protein F4822DRAFT_349421 [Hypoxylon trugodes]